MKKEQQKALKSALEEALRLAVAAFLSTMVAVLLELIPGLDLDPTIIVILMALLRAADRYVYKMNKQLTGKTKGLLP